MNSNDMIMLAGVAAVLYFVSQNKGAKKAVGDFSQDSIDFVKGLF